MHRQTNGFLAQPDCETCRLQHLVQMLKASEEGHHFTCRIGMHNYWLPIRIRSETLGIACLQALGHKPAKLLAGEFSSPFRIKMLARQEFNRAARLLRFMIDHAQTASLSELRTTELNIARRAILALESEQARLHETIRYHLPPPLQVCHREEKESQTEPAVQNLLEFISKNYAQPVTLRQCAASLRMNAAYLSTLFSRAVGHPFKSYLTELRIEKARMLLGDAGQNISDVAKAVGYANANRFRLAFKKTTGLSPRLWRMTMQLKPPSPELSEFESRRVPVKI